MLRRNEAVLADKAFLQNLDVGIDNLKASPAPLADEVIVVPVAGPFVADHTAAGRNLSGKPGLA